MFLEIQIRAAFADGLLHPNERKVLYVIAEELGISRVQFGREVSRMMQGAQSRAVINSPAAAGCCAARPDAEDACNVLGLKPPTMQTTLNALIANWMFEQSSDKLVAKGLPPEMMEMAKQKRRKFRKAYELIKNRKASGSD